jgi:hypothetical protein
MMVVGGGSSGVYFKGTISEDPFAAVLKNYLSADAVSNQFASIMLHKNSGTAFFCAKLVPVVVTSDAPTAAPQIPTSSPTKPPITSVPTAVPVTLTPSASPIQSTSTSTYSSAISSTDASGATGTFNVAIVKGTGNYEWTLDLNNFVIPAAAVTAGCTQSIIANSGLKCKIEYIIQDIILTHFNQYTYTFSSHSRKLDHRNSVKCGKLHRCNIWRPLRSFLGVQ